tara:strand:+ start:165 stop:356 length:192 start_codon:yes stop_codon:yes gene_type:complete
MIYERNRKITVRISFVLGIIICNLFKLNKTITTDKIKKKNTVNEIEYVVKSIDLYKGKIAKGV